LCIRLARIDEARKDSIEEHGFGEYAEWPLGEDEEPEQNKRRCAFADGEFKNVHRYCDCRRISGAGQYKHSDSALAASHLHGIPEELMTGQHTKANESDHLASH
jgi:hypothetical protein